MLNSDLCWASLGCVAILLSCLCVSEEFLKQVPPTLLPAAAFAVVSDLKDKGAVVEMGSHVA